MSVNAVNSTIAPAAAKVAPAAQNAAAAPAGVAAGSASTIAPAAATPAAAPKTSILKKAWNVTTWPFAKVLSSFACFLGKIFSPFKPLFKKSELQLMREELKLVKDGKFAPAEARQKLLKALKDDQIFEIFSGLGQQDRESKTGFMNWVANKWNGAAYDLAVGEEIFNKDDKLALNLWDKALSSQIAAKEKPKA